MRLGCAWLPAPVMAVRCSTGSSGLLPVTAAPGTSHSQPVHPLTWVGRLPHTDLHTHTRCMFTGTVVGMKHSAFFGSHAVLAFDARHLANTHAASATRPAYMTSSMYCRWGSSCLGTRSVAQGTYHHNSFVSPHTPLVKPTPSDVQSCARTRQSGLRVA
jgi:hypothetical protein